ncbi:MAG TPA: response regulator transcription factor [Actinomycetota bacterium]|nr:response regulator transcription factor [Actinomycetota bacterium]
MQALLATVDDIQVVGAATDDAEAIEVATRTRPEVVLMDASMPGMRGVEATRRLREGLPGVQVVMLACFADEQLLVEAVDAGAVGYLLKDADPQELIGGVRAAAKGHSPISGKVARALLTRRLLPAEILTGRERQVLSLLAAGLSNKQIAARLGIVEGTVKAHLTSIYKRIGVADRTQAAQRARRHGLTNDSG